MLTVFFGHEDRAEAGTTTFVRSVIANASEPIALVPITRKATPASPEGTNAFTMRRFLVPWFMRFNGLAVFVDGSDMLCRGDISELKSLWDGRSAVQVVKHEYQTKHPRKYVGSVMEADNADYPRKNWASVMLIWCSHFAWRQVTPDFVRKAEAMHLLQLRFIPDERIGDLPNEWNWLVDEHGDNESAKMCHFTAGIPAYKAHSNAPMADEWRRNLLEAVWTA
jgi:hypothetical protein